MGYDKRRGSLALALVLPTLLLALAACDAGSRSATRATAAPATARAVTPTGATDPDFTAFLRALAAAGATVQPGQGYPPNDLFSAPSRVVIVNSTVQLTVVEYSDVASAVEEAACFHGGDKKCPGANTMTIIDWVAPPHLYRSGRLLVVYVGTDTTTLHLLARVLGPPFDERHWSS